MAITCGNCNKHGHYKAVCRGAPQSNTQQANIPPANSSSSSRFQRGPQLGAKGSINQIGSLDQEDGTYTINAAEYAEYVRFKRTISDGINALRPDDHQDRPRVKLNVENTPITMLVDTGSPINVLDEADFNSISPKPAIQKCNTQLYGYASKAPIPIKGKCITR